MTLECEQCGESFTGFAPQALARKHEETNPGHEMFPSTLKDSE